MFRDRRVIFGAFLMPFLLIFMMMQMFGMIERSVSGGQATKIAIIRGGENSVLAKALAQVPKATIRTPATLEDGKSLLEKGDVRLVLQMNDGFDQKLIDGTAKVNAYHNSGEPLSGVAMRIVSVAIAEANKAAARAQLATKGIPATVLSPITLREHDTAKPEAKGGELLLSLLPYMIIIWAFYGGFSSVSDMMAGEKERGTLETLLLAPVNRRDIAMGKLGALSLISLSSALIAVLGVVITNVISKQSGMELRLTPSALLAVIAMVLPLVAMFSSLLFVVSTWARNMREAQTFLTSISFVVLIPAVLSNVIGFTGIDKAPWLKFVPVLNVGAGLRQALMGSPDWALVGAAAVVHFIIAGLCVQLTLSLINRDRVLARI